MLMRIWVVLRAAVIREVDIADRLPVGIELARLRIKQWRGLATRYDRHATIYRAAVLLHGIIAWTQQLSDTP